jgi:hypothetical protein
MPLELVPLPGDKIVEYRVLCASKSSFFFRINLNNNKCCSRKNKKSPSSLVKEAKRARSSFSCDIK